MLAQQNVLQLQALGQVVEIFAIFKYSLLLQLVCDKAVHFCSNFNSLTQALVESSLNLE